MNVVVSLEAKKQIKKLPKSETPKIARKLIYLETYPYMGKKLSGKLSGLYSLKAWPYRIIYEIRDNQVWVTGIEHRQGAYK